MLISNIVISYFLHENNNIRSTLLNLPENVLRSICKFLPIYSTNILSQVCCRFNDAFPAILNAYDNSKSDSSSTSIDWSDVLTNLPRVRLRLRLTQCMSPEGLSLAKIQLSSIAKWMRVYKIVLEVRVIDIKLIKSWIVCAENDSLVRWLRLNLSYHLNPIQPIRPVRINKFCAIVGNVHAIDLSSTNVTDDGVIALGNVHALNLSCTMITDVGAVALANVNILSLRATWITDVSASTLGNVHTLDLSYTKITDISAVALSKVHTLNLSSTMITDRQRS